MTWTVYDSHLIRSNKPQGRGFEMPRGGKGKYTDKQKRKAEHIEESYKERGVSEEEAEKRAWATVNAMHHGGEKPGGGGYGKPENKEPARKGGRKGGSR
jgi:plasmid stabilization system protein ParE